MHSSLEEYKHDQGNKKLYKTPLRCLVMASVTSLPQSKLLHCPLNSLQLSPAHFQQYVTLSFKQPIRPLTLNTVKLSIIAACFAFGTMTALACDTHYEGNCLAGVDCTQEERDLITSYIARDCQQTSCNKPLEGGFDGGGFHYRFTCRKARNSLCGKTTTIDTGFGRAQVTTSGGTGIGC